MNEVNQYVWAEKYRPQTLEECILPKQIKADLIATATAGKTPNLLFYSDQPGTGKTSAARAFVNDIGGESIEINGSLDGNIDTLRVEILDFASTQSFSGKHKYVILDEADYLNPTSTQPALRNFMESFSKNCGFILTANKPGRLIEPLHSRVDSIHFTIPKDERATIGKQLFDRAVSILEAEGIEYKKEVVQGIILKYFPDFRKIINKLQGSAATGKLTLDVLNDANSYEFDVLIKALTSQNFNEMRKWVAEYASQPEILSTFYNYAAAKLTPKVLPDLVMIIASYSYKGAFMKDQEINITACMVEIMAGKIF